MNLFLSVILFLVSFFYSVPNYSVPKKDYSIKVNAHSSNGPYQDYGFNNYRKDKAIKVVYFKQDSISYKLLKQNQEYQRYSKAFMQYSGKNNQEEKGNLSNKLNEISKKYIHYTRDSISFHPKHHSAFVQLLDSLYHSSKNTLERMEENKSRIVLDGTRFTIQFTSEDALVKQINVHSPDSKSHPLIARFINETFSLYRSQHSNSFLRN